MEDLLRPDAGLDGAAALSPLVAVCGAAPLADRARLILTASGRVRLVRPGDDGELDRRPLDAVVVAGSADKDLVSMVRRIREHPSGPPVIALYPAGDMHTARRALEAGAAAVVDDVRLDDALLPATLVVLHEFVAVPRELRLETVPPALSHRERQVLALLVAGHTNAEIGRRLFLAESTVKSHLSSAFAKLGVRTRRDAAALLRDGHAGLLDAPGV